MKKQLLRGAAALTTLGLAWFAYTGYRQYQEVLQRSEKQNRLFACCATSVFPLDHVRRHTTGFDRIAAGTPTAALADADKAALLSLWTSLGAGNSWAAFNADNGIEDTGTIRFAQVMGPMLQRITEIRDSAGISESQLSMLEAVAYETDAPWSAEHLALLERMRSHLQRIHEVRLAAAAKFQAMLRVAEPTLTLDDFTALNFYSPEQHILGSALVCLLRPDVLPNHPMGRRQQSCRAAPSALHFALTR